MVYTSGMVVYVLVYTIIFSDGILDLRDKGCASINPDQSAIHESPILERLLAMNPSK